MLKFIQIVAIAMSPIVRFISLQDDLMMIRVGCGNESHGDRAS